MKKILPFGVSATVHASLIFLLIEAAPQFTPIARKGVVTVALVEAAPVHGVTEKPAPRSASKLKRQPKPTPSIKREPKPDSLPNLGKPGVIGDERGMGVTSDYIGQVMTLLDRNKRYPRSAILREEEGKITLSLTLARDGSVMDLRVEKPCAFGSLNEAALATVRAITRFPPLPPQVSEPMHLQIPLVFSIDH